MTRTRRNNRRKQNNNAGNGNLSQLQNVEKKLAIISSSIPTVERKYNSRNVDLS